MKINVEIESIQKEGNYIVGTLSLEENFKKETFDLECIMKEDNSGFEYAFLNGINLMTNEENTCNWYPKEELVKIYSVGRAATGLIIDFYESDNLNYKKNRRKYNRLN